MWSAGISRLIMLVACEVCCFRRVQGVRLPTQVEQGSVKLLERWGRYERTLEPGLHWYVPVAEGVRFVCLRERCESCGLQACRTEDGYQVEARAALQYRVVDPVRYAYSTEEDPLALLQVVAKSHLAVAVGALSLDACCSTRQHGALAEGLRENLAPLARASWGLELTRVVIEDLRQTTSAVNEVEEEDTSQDEVESYRMRREASREALSELRDTIGCDSAFKLETLRLHYEALCNIASSPTVKTLLIFAPQGSNDDAGRAPDNNAPVDITAMYAALLSSTTSAPADVAVAGGKQEPSTSVFARGIW